MKIIRKASGKRTVKISKSEWEDIGLEKGWLKEAGMVGDAFKKAIQWLQSKYPSEFSQGQQIAQQSGGDPQKLAELLGVQDENTIQGIQNALQEAKSLDTSEQIPQQQATANSNKEIVTAINWQYHMGYSIPNFVKKHWKVIGIVGVVAILAIVFGPMIAEALQGGGAEAGQAAQEAAGQAAQKAYDSGVMSEIQTQIGQLAQRYNSLTELRAAEQAGEVAQGTISRLQSVLSRGESSTAMQGALRKLNFFLSSGGM